MYQNNEEEIELLRQYEDEDPLADKHKYFSDGMDSDLEDKIVSIVQYQAGVTKEPSKANLSMPETRPTYTTTANSSKSSANKIGKDHASENTSKKHTVFAITDEHADVSFLSKEREKELVLDNTMSTSSSDTEGLQVTSYISLDKEDREQNLKIHELVDSIIKCFVLNATSPDTQIMTAARVVIGQVTADGVKKMIILLSNVKINSRHTVEQKRKKEKDSISHLGKHTYQDNEDDDNQSLSDDSTEVKSAISISSDDSSQDTNVNYRMDISKKRRGEATDDDDSDDDRESSYNKDKKLQSTSKRRKLNISDDTMTKRKPI
ncbi:hypothetical protein G6F43_010687 [Rhizopus delemar]|nr:hypothetical protein G6F43_010687 [Rhizopus delemar]